MKREKAIQLVICLLLLIGTPVSTQDVYTQADLIKDNDILPQLISVFGGYDEDTTFSKLLFNSSEEYLATLSSTSNELFVWEVRRSFMISRIAADVPITDFAFYPTRDEIYTAHIDGSIISWSVTTGQQMLNFSTGERPIRNMYFADNSLLWINTGVSKVTLYDPLIGIPILDVEAQGNVIDMFLDAANNSLALLTDDGTIEYYNTQILDGEPVASTQLSETPNEDSQIFLDSPSSSVVASIDGSSATIINFADPDLQISRIEGFDYLPMFDNSRISLLPYKVGDRVFNFPMDDCLATITEIEARVFFSTVFDVSYDCSILILLIEDPDDPQRFSAISLIDTFDGMEFYFFGNTVDAQFSPSGQYLLNATNEGKMLLFRVS